MTSERLKKNDELEVGIVRLGHNQDLHGEIQQAC